MQVAITGGTGFIGSCLVKAHLLRGDSVRVLTRKKQSIELGVEYIIGDLLDKNFDGSQFVKGADVLYHCAGQLNDESTMKELHINGMLRLLGYANGAIKRWVQLSSVGVYKKQRQGIIDEQAEIDPEGTYEETKALADEKLIEYATKNSLCYSILRPSNVFGPSMTNQSLASLVRLIKRKLFFYIGKSNPVVNYVTVDDVVRALILCATEAKAENMIYNLSQSISIEAMITALALGSGADAPTKHMPETLIRVITSVLEIIPGFPLSTDRIDALTNHVVFNSDKISKELGFTFKSDLTATLNDYSLSIQA